MELSFKESFADLTKLILGERFLMRARRSVVDESSSRREIIDEKASQSVKGIPKQK